MRKLILCAGFFLVVLPTRESLAQTPAKGMSHRRAYKACKKEGKKHSELRKCIALKMGPHEGS